MSIIHDALKKAEEFKTGKKTETDAEALLGLDQAVAKPKKKNQASPKAIIGVALAFMMVLAFVFFGRNFLNDVIAKMRGMTTSAPAQVEVVQAPIDPTILEQQKAQELKKLEEEKLGETQKKVDEFLSMFEKGNYEEALTSIEELIQTMPTEPKVYNNYGIVLKRMGRKSEALAAYGKALALDPNYAEALNNMAAIYLSGRDYAKAKELLLKALEISPGYLDADLHLAIAYEKNDELEKAKQQYRYFLQESEGKVDKKIRLQIEERLAGLVER